MTRVQSLIPARRQKRTNTESSPLTLNNQKFLKQNFLLASEMKENGEIGTEGLSENAEVASGFYLKDGLFQYDRLLKDF